jgi:hypothetical protein
MQQLDVERFNLRMLNDMEVKEQYEVKISNKTVALENLDDSGGGGGGGDDDDDDDDDDDVDISRGWESIRKNIKVSATELNNLSYGLIKSAQNYWIK